MPRSWPPAPGQGATLPLGLGDAMSDALRFAPPAASAELLKAMQQVGKLISEYIHVHGAKQHEPRSTPSAKPRGGREYWLVGEYGCPLQFGNRMHEYLNAFAVAFATHRTLLWRFKGKNPQELCDRLLHRRTWMTPFNSTRTRGSTRALGFYYDDTPRRLACTDMHPSGAGAVSNVSIVDIGHVQWHQSAALVHSVSSSTARRAAQLFGAGADFAFGSLFHRSFHWDTPSVVLPVHRALQAAGLIGSTRHLLNATARHETVAHNYDISADLRTLRGAAWIGVHMRHFGAGDDGTRNASISGWWGQIVQHIRARSPPAATGVSSAQSQSQPQPLPRCALLVASDREGAIRSLRPLAAAEGCALVSSPRADVGDQQGDWMKEHGNFTDTVAMRDLYLLSLADSLVGTAGSSFTAAIGEQLAARYTGGRSLPVIQLCASGARAGHQLLCGEPLPLIVHTATARKTASPLVVAPASSASPGLSDLVDDAEAALGQHDAARASAPGAPASGEGVTLLQDKLDCAAVGTGVQQPTIPALKQEANAVPCMCRRPWACPCCWRPPVVARADALPVGKECPLGAGPLTVRPVGVHGKRNATAH